MGLPERDRRLGAPLRRRDQSPTRGTEENTTTQSCRRPSVSQWTGKHGRFQVKGVTKGFPSLYKNDYWLSQKGLQVHKDLSLKILGHFKYNSLLNKFLNPFLNPFLKG